MVKKMHSRTRRTKRKTRGGRRSESSSTSEFGFRRPRSRSESPGRIRIIDTPQTPLQPLQQLEQLQQLQQPNQIGPVTHELFRFRVKCMNGETHTSHYIYTRGAARNAAREYCSTRGGVDGRIEYDITFHVR